MSWRLRWTMREITERGGYRKHRSALKHPSHFYLALFRKLVPGLSHKEIPLHLSDGHVLNVHQFMTLFIYREIFVDRCYDVRIDRTDPVIVDIGANTGLFALRMKQLFPAAKVVCYEPFPPNFAQLQQTISSNNLAGVSAVPKAVGARKGSALLYIHERNVGGHSFYPAQASSRQSIAVEVMDLDSVLAECPAPVDLLKLDCEGAEFDILMNSSNLSRKVRQVIFEPSPKLYDIRKLLGCMNAMGFQHEWRNGLYRLWRPECVEGNA
jgi:FkbM family methyltransferase